MHRGRLALKGPPLNRKNKKNNSYILCLIDKKHPKIHLRCQLPSDQLFKHPVAVYRSAFPLFFFYHHCIAPMAIKVPKEIVSSVLSNWDILSSTVFVKACNLRKDFCVL